MNIENYFISLSSEMTALKNRIRDFIDNSHWLSDGEWKESVLRSVIARNLPRNIQMGRGFMLSPSCQSTQIDILLYSAESPVLFRDGDFVIVQPEAVRGVIEVKTKLNRNKFKETLRKIIAIGDMLPQKRQPFLSIFAYESNVKPQDALELLCAQTTNIKQIVHHICFGDSHFIRYWKNNPEIKSDSAYEQWHSYQLGKMAYGYFVHNILQSLIPEYVDQYANLWFPENSKEIRKDGSIQRCRGIGEPFRLY